ncbi:MAG: hypothetical protein OEZ51_15095 [Nitrospinota bacterium]|nr:hypothetical protein [Nitrospinota bacterium]
MRWMVLMLGLFLSGCVAHYQARYQGPPPMQSTTLVQVDSMVGAQQPVEYKVGFMEGCDSGHVSAGNNSFIFKKDVERFGKDDLYKQGWTDGFNRCASGGGVTAGNNYQSYYGYDYYPGTFYSGFYYPSYYYAPGYSIWLGYYGYPRHRHYVHHDHYYYSPWYGGNKHKHGRSNYRGGDYYIGQPRGGGKSYGGGGGKRNKGRSHKGGGNKSGGSYWIR